MRVGLKNVNDLLKVTTRIPPHSSLEILISTRRIFVIFVFVITWFDAKKMDSYNNIHELKANLIKLYGWCVIICFLKENIRAEIAGHNLTESSSLVSNQK